MAKKAAAKTEGITSLEELDAKEQFLTAKMQGEETGLKARYQALMVTSVDGVDVSIAARKAVLQTRIAEFCEANRAALLVDDKKSRKLTHGTFGWRERPLSLNDEGTKAEGSESKTVISALLLAARKALQVIKSKFFKGLQATDVISLEIKWDKAGLLKKYKAELITKDALEQAGFKVQGGEDVFFADPASALVKSES